MPTSPASETLTETLYRTLSTNYSSDFERSKFMGEVVSDVDDSVWIDPLDPSLLSMLSGDMQYDIFSYRSESLTTISYTYYKTTTLWWLILMANGFLHPHEIPSGYRLKIPKMAYIMEKVKKPTTDSIKGQVITI